jgi:lantibiotic modifying enzyme
MAVKAAILSRMGRQQEALQAQEAVEALGQDVLQLPPEDCELLYGRCGYIYALLIARQYTGNNSAATQQLIKTLLQQVVQEGQKNAKQVGGTFSLLYQWHGTIYLGAAHGLAGITMTLCQAFPELLELYPTDALNLVTDEIAGLVQVTFPSGNLPSSLGKDKDKLIQWCHGAPGFVPLLAEAHRLLGKYQGQAAASSDFYGPQMQADVVKAGEAAGDQIWHRGLLKKGLGLCHGISGNTYALLSLYRLSGHAVWLRRAEQFALFAADKWQDLLSLPDAPLSLYEGAAGMVSLWADLLDPDSARFPGYEL